jgi:hypothetical protein
MASRVTPPLVRFLLKWTAIAVVIGWAALGVCLLLDIGPFREMVTGSRSPAAMLLLVALTFAVSFWMVIVSAAVLLRDDFGGEVENLRLKRWKDGKSGQLRDSDPIS